MAQTLLKEPYLSALLERIVREFEIDIPSIGSSIGVISKSEVSLNTVLRKTIGEASIRALFGEQFLKNFPSLLDDIYTLDAGMAWLLIRTPPWIPIGASTKAHKARSRLWKATTAYNVALDAALDGNQIDPSWGDMQDVSEVVRMSHELYRRKLSLTL